MATTPRAYTTQKAHRRARDLGEIITLNQDEARAIRQQTPFAADILKAHRKYILREISERLKRLQIVENEIDCAAAAGANVELPISFYALALAPEDGL